ncbi:MAG: tRNA (guanine(10)-N(2))-dimethyltransferase [Promethearchaeota archaeon]
MYEEHKEGAITFLRPPLQKIPTTSMTVFYNPKSELNRDITIVALQVFISEQKKTKTRICTPLAGTGVRPIRIAKELNGIGKVIVGDANPQAIELIQKNCKMNGVEDILEVYHKEANRLLTEFVAFENKFDIIDIDPFGSPREFFTSAIRALKPPALLCLTATDMPVLVGIRRRTCIKRYAAVPLKVEYAHELAVRILIGSIVREAAALNIGLNPLLSFSVDHYIRVYCLANEGDAKTWKAISQLGFILHCSQCGYRSASKGLVPKSITCVQCGSEKVEQAGPLWIGKMGEEAFVKRMLQELDSFQLGQKQRALTMLTKIREELRGPPTYYDLHRLADKLNVPIPPFREVINRLQKKGLFCVRTHFSPHAIRTSASEELLSELLVSLTGEK